MPIEPLVLIGAGGHAAVVLDALGARAVRVVDEDAGRAGQTLLGHAITAPFDPAQTAPGQCHVAVGDNRARAALAVRLQALGWQCVTIVHPDASVSPHASLGDGSFVAARAVIGPRTALGSGAIVNHGAVVDHDCRLGDFCHVAPNATLGGGVRLGDGVLVGAGAVLLPGRTVADRAVVGAGAVVTQDVGPDQAVTGVPARAQGRQL